MRMPTKWQLILKSIEANHAVKDLQSFSQPFISTGVGPTLPFWLFEASDDVGNLSKVRFNVEFVWLAMIITYLFKFIDFIVRLLSWELLNINWLIDLTPGNESAEAITSDCGCVFEKACVRVWSCRFGCC